MKKIISFKNFESTELDDKDVEFDDVEVEQPQTQPVSDEDPSEVADTDENNKKEFENLHEAVDDLVNQNAQSDNEKKELKLTVKKDGIDAANLKGFTEENDIYDFYLEYQYEIDEKLDDIDFFNEPPSKYAIESLYDYTIQGTKIAVESIIIDMD